MNFITANNNNTNQRSSVSESSDVASTDFVDGDIFGTYDDAGTNVPPSQESFSDNLYSSITKKDSSLLEYNTYAKSTIELNSNAKDKIYQFNPTSSSYYCNLTDNHYNASSQIIAKANNVHLSAVKQFTYEETKQQMLLAKLSRSLTKTQLHDFSSYLQSLSKTHISKNNKIEAICKNVPTRASDFRRLYIDGTNSISQNVPKPSSVMLNHHSYVSVMDCIGDFFAYNTVPISNLQQLESYTNDQHHIYDNIFNSNAAKTVVLNLKKRVVEHPPSMIFPVVPCLLYLWSDDFDPINSIKKNRQSVWIITCTILVLSTKNEVVQHTYPIAVGRKGLDHSEVFSSLFEELKKLFLGELTVMYCTSLRYPVYVHAEIVSILADQLERRANTKLGAGNHMFHRRWGFSCNMEAIRQYIHACPSCIERNNNEKRKINH